jgi:hypothetical protein
VTTKLSTRLEPQRQPWYTIWGPRVSAVVASVAIVISALLGYANYRLAIDKSKLDNDNYQLSVEKNKLDTANYQLSVEKNELEQRVLQLNIDMNKLAVLEKRHQLSVDLEARYYIVTGLSLLDIDARDVENENDRPAIVQNQVLQALQPWHERWTGGDSPVVDLGGVTRSHGFVMLRVTNLGRETAQALVLTTRRRDFFSEGEESDYLWQLQTGAWETSELRLADLQAGRSVMVPLAHVFGTGQYFGPVVMPVKLDWYNATLAEHESKAVAGMAPADQWIAKGLNIAVAQ